MFHAIGAVGSAKQYRQEVCCNGHLYVQAGALDHVRYGGSYTVHRLQIPVTAEIFHEQWLRSRCVREALATFLSFLPQ